MLDSRKYQGPRDLFSPFEYLVEKSNITEQSMPCAVIQARQFFNKIVMNSFAPVTLPKPFLLCYLAQDLLRSCFNENNCYSQQETELIKTSMTTLVNIYLKGVWDAAGSCKKQIQKYSMLSFSATGSSNRRAERRAHSASRTLGIIFI